MGVDRRESALVRDQRIFWLVLCVGVACALLWSRGVLFLLVAVPPAALGLNLLLHASQPPSTWATGRGGFVLAVTAIVACTKKTGDGVTPLLSGDVVAFAEAKITETYREGQNSRTIPRATIRPKNELHVADESGEGVLDLSDAVLDVETRKLTFKELPPGIAAAGHHVERHPYHVSYTVEERVVRDGETLYVFGDVSAVDMRPDERGYRTVRGSPTLGGGDEPLLVYAGDERGLLTSLEAEARRAHRLAVAAACVAGLVSAATAFLAWL